MAGARSYGGMIVRALLLRSRSLVVLLALVACAETSTRPSAPALAKGPADPAALEAQINGLIGALFAPTDQGAVKKEFARIKNAVARSDDAEAQAGIVAFVRELLEAREDGVLQDPNGAAPPSLGDALLTLVNAVAEFGGLPPPIPPSNPFAGDGAVAVVGPAGGTVVSSTGFGGVGFPAGALPEDVIVVVARLPNPTVPGTGPLPTTLTQYPLFYDFSTVPLVPQFAVDVTVGLCQLEVGAPFGPPTQSVADRLQIAHPDPANPGQIELLERTLAPFVDCDGVTLAKGLDAPPGSLAGRAMQLVRGGGGQLFDLLRPARAHAVHGGLGGKTRSFSPFAAVDPGVITPEPGILAVGNFHSCLIENSGSTVCWGSDFFGMLGDGPPGSSVPLARVPVAGSPSFVSIVTNGQYTCGTLAGGANLCWGRNPSLTAPQLSPTLLPFGPFISISPARLTACALTPANAAVCWGLNQLGELGDGTQLLRTTPVPVSTGLAFASIEASWIHTCALTFAGAAHCWGAWRGRGQTQTIDLTPVAVPGGHAFARLYTGGTHTCGLTLINEAWCWGDNASGQLGDGTTVGGGTPVLVSGGHSFAMMDTGTTPNSGGTSHTCGITTGGKAYCWGLNDQGQIGDGSTTTRLTPVPVLSSEIFVAIGAGDRSTCAMTTDRRVFCWGSNAAGELGSGTAGGFSSTPVLVP